MVQTLWVYHLQGPSCGTFRDINYFLVWFLVQSRVQTDMQTDRQIDRKRCIWAHRANCTGGLKNNNTNSVLLLYWYCPNKVDITVSIMGWKYKLWLVGIFSVFHNFIYIKDHRIKRFAHTPKTTNQRKMKRVLTMLWFEMKNRCLEGCLSKMDNSDGLMSLERQRNHYLLQFKTLFLTNFYNLNNYTLRKNYYVKDTIFRVFPEFWPHGQS